MRFRELATIATGIVLVLLLGHGAAASEVSGLTQAERDGYLTWLHSLNATHAARDAEDREEARRLFPFDREWVPGEPSGDPLRLLAVSRAVGSFERRPRILVDTAALTAGKALALARNYCHLAEYDSALSWYEIASDRDRRGEYVGEVQREAMACAAALDDSVRFTRWLLETLGRGDLTGADEEICVAYRRLVGQGDGANLRLLVEATRGDTTLVDGRVRFWQAYGQSSLGNWAGALATLRPLLHPGGLSHGLTEAQRAWVLVAVPDLLVLGGELETARPLYTALRQCQLPGVAAWAACQAANLDFLAGRYDVAGLVFSELCEDAAAAPWRDYACEMADLATSIDRIRAEGAPYGTERFYTP